MRLLHDLSKSDISSQYHLLVSRDKVNAGELMIDMTKGKKGLLSFSKRFSALGTSTRSTIFETRP